MVTTTSGSLIATAGETLPLSSLFTITPDVASYLLLLSDDNQYSADQPGTYGYLRGSNSQVLKLLSSGGTSISTYALFTYDSTTGQYTNKLLGNLADVSYVALSGTGHQESLSLAPPEGNPATLSVLGGSAYAALSNATPSALSSIAQSLVGQVWNDNSCWLLAANISARAGASLPVTSGFLSPPGYPTTPLANGEWIVVYDGETQANPTIASAEAVLRPGDVIDLTWAGGGNGHVTTVVSGFGAAAQVIDDWNFGTNVVNDGTGSDLTIQAAHPLDAELTGTALNPVPGGPIIASIQIYRLDTPTITAVSEAKTLANQTLALAPLFTVQDAGGAGKLPITEYAFYDTGGAFVANGATTVAHSADQKIVVPADMMASLELQAPASGTDTVYVSAYNGQYWGDWTALSVTVTGRAVTESAQDVAASLDSLAAQIETGDLTSIILSDGGTPTLTITAAQFLADKAALNDISSAHAVVVQMSGNAAQHDFSGENWIGANALQFSDQTVIVAATPGSSSVTTGNVTELYSAVLAREPDVGGLAFYQAFLKANPATPLLTFADYFLGSPEYTAAHSYVPGAAGDTQFIEDSYQNLLHRTPSSDEVTFYLASVMTQPDAHALMLVYFSASAEFLKDVEITAQNAASAQHWLLLT